jgi:benzoate-CoA ligase
MPELSSANHGVSPPRITVPRDYNAAYDLIQRNLRAGRGAKVAYIDDRGTTTYDQLAERVNRFGNVLGKLGIVAEQRVMLCLLDTIDFPTAFLGSIQAGIVPVALNTLLTTNDYDYMLGDSRASALFVSEALWPQFASVVGKHPTLEHVVISGEDGKGKPRLSDLMSDAGVELQPAATTCDDMCFWLYSSGSTGKPKGTVHVHSHLIQTAELYGRPILGVREDDLVFSAAKLFFAYGLGNGLSFPLSVGATTLLMAERPTPASVFKRLREHKPSVFCGVPTLYAAMMASPEMPRRRELRLRICASAGEALPAEIGRRFTEHFGVEILDGIGSTEMLHIFLSNRAGKVRYGTTGTPVPGYEVRLIGDDGQPVPIGEIGELQVCGPTSALMYWNNRERTRNTFLGDWTRSGDKYVCDAEGYYHYCGRTDDMLKVGGIYVSPFEVEAALMTHEAVLEAAVVGHADSDELVKPKAFVVLKPGHGESPAMAEALRQHVKDRLAPYKYPRWVEFLNELPKTATGKIQRYKLR